MRFLQLISAAVLAPTVGLAAPAAVQDADLSKRENLCSLKAPPALCQPDPSVSVEETARRAYKFYRSFVVDGDPKTMFSLIDSTYKQHHPGYADGPQNIWSLFCAGRKIGSESSTSWCFDASTNMSYAKYSTVDRWRWLDGCVHEHWDTGESIPQETSGIIPRTRADRVLKVVSDLSVKDSSSLSPETATAAEKLLDKAHQPSSDVELVEAAAELLRKACDRKSKAEELDKLNFLFDIGD